MRSKTSGLLRLCPAALFTFSFAQLGQAQGSAGSVESGSAMDVLVGKDVRTTIVTSAEWTGKMLVLAPYNLNVESSSDAYTISKGAVRFIKHLNLADQRRFKSAAEESAAEADGFRIYGSNTAGAAMAPYLIEVYGIAFNRANAQVTPGKVDEERTIVLAGTATARPIAVELAFQKAGTAFTLIASKAVDLRMASRPVNKEREAAIAAGLGDLRSVAQEYMAGLDGLAVIINHKNSVTSLTVAQIAAIFTGAIADWSEVGGSTSSIMPSPSTSRRRRDLPARTAAAE